MSAAAASERVIVSCLYRESHTIATWLVLWTGLVFPLSHDHGLALQQVEKTPTHLQQIIPGSSLPAGEQGAQV